MFRKYCYDKVASPASALYYSLRYLDARERDQVVAVHAFYQEVTDILFECQDHELALIKFNWWRSEVAKLVESKPDHPVLIFLLEVVPNAALLQEKLLLIIDGVEQGSIPAPFATFDEIIVHYMRTAGERELLLQTVLQKNILTQEKRMQAMLVIELVNYLQHLHRYVRHGLIYFSEDEMQKLNLRQDVLRELKTTDEIKKLLQGEVEKIARAYEQVMDGLTKQQRREESHLMIRCEIAWKICEEICRSDFVVLENFITLTPLRFWWIAWRS